VFGNAHCMRRDNERGEKASLVPYIPREMQERFQALNTKLKPMREEGWRTRVKIGQRDFYVARKSREGGFRGSRFENIKVDMSDLPPVQLGRPRQMTAQRSPAKGREGREEAEEARQKRMHSEEASEEDSVESGGEVEGDSRKVTDKTSDRRNKKKAKMGAK
jgi:hypothetical protein